MSHTNATTRTSNSDPVSLQEDVSSKVLLPKREQKLFPFPYREAQFLFFWEGDFLLSYYYIRIFILAASQVKANLK